MYLNRQPGASNTKRHGPGSRVNAIYATHCARPFQLQVLVGVYIARVLRLMSKILFNYR